MKNKKVFELKKEYHADILVHSSIENELKAALNDAERKVEYLQGKIKSNNYELWEILHKAASRGSKDFNLRFDHDKMILEEFKREEDIFRLFDGLKRLGFNIGEFPTMIEPEEDEDGENGT